MMDAFMAQEPGNIAKLEGKEAGNGFNFAHTDAVRVFANPPHYYQLKYILLINFPAANQLL